MNIFDNLRSLFAQPHPLLDHKDPHPFHPLLDRQGHWDSDGPRLLVLSGSGISVASGVPTYRSKNGLWLNTPVDQVCNFNTWENNKAQVEHFYSGLWQHLKDCIPNVGHQILDSLPAVHYTQNVDGLCTNALPLHGSLARLECLACHEQWEHKGNMDLAQPCPACQEEGHTKPAVVFFYQHPPMYHVFLNTLQGLREQDVLLVVGTSGEVVPIAQWCNVYNISCTKWLYNAERSTHLPEQMFNQVVIGPFEHTCFDLKDRWQQHCQQVKK